MRYDIERNIATKLGAKSGSQKDEYEKLYNRLRDYTALGDDQKQEQFKTLYRIALTYALYAHRGMKIKEAVTG